MELEKKHRIEMSKSNIEENNIPEQKKHRLVEYKTIIKEEWYSRTRKEVENKRTEFKKIHELENKNTRI